MSSGLNNTVRAVVSTGAASAAGSVTGKFQWSPTVAVVKPIISAGWTQVSRTPQGGEHFEGHTGRGIAPSRGLRIVPLPLEHTPQGGYRSTGAGFPTAVSENVPPHGYFPYATGC